MSVGNVQQSAAHNAALLGASMAVPVTPSDNADLTNGACRSVYAHTAGNIAMVLLDDPNGTAHVFAFAAGEIKPLQARQIWATNTTVTGQILALY